MKNILTLFLIIGACSAASGQIKRLTPKDTRFLETLPGYSDDELFDLKQKYAIASNSNTNAVLLAIGVPTMVSGILINNMDNGAYQSDASNIAIGGGALLTLIGMFLGTASDTKREIWIERELFRRKEVTIGMAPAGMRVSFGR